MLRRKFVQLGLSSLAIGAAGVGCAPSNKKTNVLFIAIDDLNTWIGCLSHLREGVPSAKTPNLDKLAGQGMLFTNAHTPVPWCMPARNNMLTGLYANQSHIYSDELFREFLPNIRTLPEHFKDSGYYTLAAGKIFHDTYPQINAWDKYEQFPRPASQRRRNPSLNKMGGEGVVDTDTFDWGQISVDKKELTDVKIADWAVNALSQNYEKPFFMGVGFRFPHLPWYLPESYLQKYPLEEISLPWVKEDDLDDVPLAAKKMALGNPFSEELRVENSDYYHVVKSNNWKKAVQAYMAAITCVDEQLGRVISALDSGRYSDNTIVVLWSDNGFHLGEKLHWRKFTLWDQATRIPLILRAPKVTIPQTTSNQAVSLVDLYPTLIELCGLPQPGHKLSGESLVPLLKNSDAKKNTPAFITYGKGNDSVVDERWRYIRYADNSEELYDHKVDPHEWENLSGKKEFLDIKNQLKAFLG
jgi:arylsulfatase A-like enzyme